MTNDFRSYIVYDRKNENIGHYSLLITRNTNTPVDHIYRKNVHCYGV